MIEFTPMGKTMRFNRGVVVTEKIDGTNASVIVAPAGDGPPDKVIATVGELEILAGSRTRFITPGDDNFGFAKWVQDNAESLAELGPGQHFGEWWGQGIQRRYGLTEKRFSLFNVSRWEESRPECCHVVPILWAGGNLTELDVVEVAKRLTHVGSLAAPGFDKPEGLIVYLESARICLKYTLDGDGHKGSD